MSKSVSYILDDQGRKVRLNKRGKPKTHHLLVFFISWLLTIAIATPYFVAQTPAKMDSGYRDAILVNGLGSGAPIPVNTLYTVPDIASPATASSGILTTGNQDTLYTCAWLDLSAGPLLLEVPDMADRYYSIQLTDPQTDSVFYYIGSRTTGTAAGTFLITGPNWDGVVQSGITVIVSPNNEVLLLARVFVRDADDVQTAYELSRKITLTR